MVEQESSQFRELERVLVTASSIPYNNGTIAFELAGQTYDERFGGSCLNKLHALVERFPAGVDNVRVITSVIGNTTHFALLASLNDKEYYFDPFLWQGEMLPTAGEPSEVNAIAGALVIRRLDPENGELLRTQLVGHINNKETVLADHHFKNELDELPAKDSLDTDAEKPNFNIQIPGDDGEFYKLWYSKEGKHVIDIFVTHKDGTREKVDHNDQKRHYNVMRKIENELGGTEEELADFFNKAYEFQKVYGKKSKEAVV